MNPIRSALHWLYVRKYGVRGGIKPPVWRGKNRLWYEWRSLMWRLEDALYTLTGIPERWERWMTHRYGSPMNRTELKDKGAPIHKQP